MAKNDEMPEVDFQKDEKLKTVFMYSKFIEQKNLERAKIATKNLRNKRIIFSACLGLTVGIYAYTILKVKQETFLDDFDEPERIVKAE